MSDTEKPEFFAKLDSSKNFCVYPFLQISTVPAGFMRPCCFFARMLHKKGGHHYNIADSTIEETWNGEDLRYIRLKMLADEEVSACVQCRHEESQGSVSMRRRGMQDWFHREDVRRTIANAGKNDGVVAELPRFLELKPGNLCNLKCRMCNQFDSVQVANELKAIQKKFNVRMAKEQSRLFDDGTFELDFTVDSMPDWSANKAVWESVEKILPGLEMLSFAGGEPTLIPKVHEVIKRCVETGHSKHIHVFFASNFTRIRPDLIELSKHFKMFEFIASIDGTEAVQEYIRSPSKWPEISRNFERVKSRMAPPNMKAVVNYTLQMYNVLTLTDTLRWLDELHLREPPFYEHPYNINMLYFPRYLSIEFLPPRARKIAIERLTAYIPTSPVLKRFPALISQLETVLRLLSQPPPAETYRKHLTEFWRFTQIIDEHRGERLSDAEPLLHEIVAEEVRNLGIEQRPVTDTGDSASVTELSP